MTNTNLRHVTNTNLHHVTGHLFLSKRHETPLSLAPDGPSANPKALPENLSNNHVHIFTHPFGHTPPTTTLYHQKVGKEEREKRIPFRNPTGPLIPPSDLGVAHTANAFMPTDAERAPMESRGWTTVGKHGLMLQNCSRLNGGGNASSKRSRGDGRWNEVSRVDPFFSPAGGTGLSEFLSWLTGGQQRSLLGKSPEASESEMQTVIK